MLDSSQTDNSRNEVRLLGTAVHEVGVRDLNGA